MESAKPRLWVLPTLGIAYAAALALLLAVDPPLGHDEAVYAVGGRGLLLGGPTPGFELYRPEGMKLVAVPGIVLGGSEVALRAVPLGILLAFLVSALLVTRAWFGRTAASVFAAACLSWSHLAWRGVQLLSDVAAMFAALGMTWFLHRLLTLERPSARLRTALLGGLCGAGAFWLRYGAILAIVVTLPVILVCWWGRARARSVHLAVFLVVLGAALLPFFLRSNAATGSWTGILELAPRAAGREFIGEGLLYYAANFLGEAAGPIIGPLAIIGLLVAAIDLAQGSRSWRAILAVSGTAQILWLGLTVHGEPRYIFFPLLLLAMAGADAVGRYLEPLLGNAAVRRRVAWGIGFSVLAGLVVFALSVRAMHRMADLYQPIAVQARIARSDSGGASCRIFTRHRPQVAWYSGCDAVAIRPPLSARDLAGAARSYLLVAPWTQRSIRQLLDRDVVARPIAAAGSSARNSSSVYRLSAAAAP